MGPSAKAALLAGLIGSTVALHGRDLSFNDTEGEDRDDDNGECKKRGGEEAWETFKELQERPRPLKPEDVDGYERLLDPDVKIEDGEGDTIVGPHKFVAGISEATPDRFTGEESNILDDQVAVRFLRVYPCGQDSRVLLADVCRAHLAVREGQVVPDFVRDEGG
mmetsp:Transcript_129834/g.403826  ORF Transcript_129834/g.403826 Transcript_129834/m.403826 type:complete len:164 (-) Transcript_129834:116-607(-)